MRTLKTAVEFQYTTDRAMITGIAKHWMDDTIVTSPYIHVPVTRVCGTLLLKESANLVCLDFL